MKKFNPEKELSKIRNGNKKKVIISICALLVVGVLGYSFALYQVRHTQKLVYTTVSDFKKRDIYLSVLVDGKTQGDFPKNNEGKIYSGIECDKPYGEAYFDNTEWKLHFTSDGPNKCTVKFETGNLPNAPELYQGMIPVVYGDNGLMYVADTSKDWYNYQDHRWANAVLVDASNTTIKNKYFNGNNLRTDIAGVQVPMEEVLQMYVWIPRYKYQLFNVDNGSVPKQLINIAFENGEASTGTVSCTYTDTKNGKVTENCTGATKDAWYTHPAFTFGNTNLKGFWVGKFEPSDPSNPNGRANNVINEITILPGKTSMIYKSVSTAFIAEQKLNDIGNKYNLSSNEVDTRVMKNSEWGAVAYLSQSIYGIYKDYKTCNIDNMAFDDCEIWINNTVQGAGIAGVTYVYGGTYTGCVGDSAKAEAIFNTDDGSIAKCKIGNRWNEKGVNASTTGNMYGIYDMSGGAWEYVMGVIVNQTDGGLYLGNSGFKSSTLPESKYYDMYTFSESDLTHERGHLGDATRETLANFGKNPGGWNGGLTDFPYVTTNRVGSWFLRGGMYTGNTHNGVFTIGSMNGDINVANSFRSILSAA